MAFPLFRNSLTFVQLRCPPTTDPGNIYLYGLGWYIGTSPDANLAPDSEWTHAMMDSRIMEIDRSQLSEQLRTFCKNHPRTVNNNPNNGPMPPDFHLGGELPTIPKPEYLFWLLPTGIVFTPIETFVGSWSDGTIHILSIDCCDHKAKIHVHGINKTGLSSLTHVPDDHGHYKPSHMGDITVGDSPMHTITQVFDWDETVSF